MELDISVNNIFFSKNVPKEWFCKIIRKNVDIFNMTRVEVCNPPENIIGIGLISLSDDDMESIINEVEKSESYWIIGEEKVSLTGTSIMIDALIIEQM
jgi:hypothetical protein